MIPHKTKNDPKLKIINHWKYWMPVYMTFLYYIVTVETHLSGNQDNSTDLGLKFTVFSRDLMESPGSLIGTS